MLCLLYILSSFRTVRFCVTPGPLRTRHRHKIRNARNLLGVMSVRKRGGGSGGNQGDSDADLIPVEGDREGRKTARLDRHALDCSAVRRKVQQGHRGLLESRLPVRGLQSPQQWAALVPPLSRSWLGVDCRRCGLHSNTVMEHIATARSNGPYTPCSGRSERCPSATTS